MTVEKEISGNIFDRIRKSIVKYRNNPSIKAIKRISNSNYLFSFDTVERDKILKEISSLDHTKHVENQLYPQNCQRKFCYFFRSFSSLV